MDLKLRGKIIGNYACAFDSLLESESQTEHLWTSRGSAKLAENPPLHDMAAHPIYILISLLITQAARG